MVVMSKTFRSKMHGTPLLGTKLGATQFESVMTGGFGFEGVASA